MSEEFIREVDEDLRHKQLTNLWKKYGRYFITLLVGIVLFVAGNVGYKNYNEGLYGELATQYGASLKAIEESNTENALNRLKEVSGKEVEGFEILSAFKQAELHTSLGDKQAAVASLDILASSEIAPDVYRDLARLQAAMILLDNASYEAISTRLTPLAVSGNPWQYIAKEMMAMAAAQSGNPEEAKRLLSELAEDLEVPDNIKFRAKQFNSVIK